jgi:hypothetical protein
VLQLPDGRLLIVEVYTVINLASSSTQAATNVARIEEIEEWGY